MEEEKPKLEEDLTSKPDENVHKKEVKNDDEIRIRQDKVVNFFKKKANWIYYILLAFLVYIAVYIRTLNLSKLKDVTTGTWTLGPDLDPFLFLRWAKYIAVNGSLMALDTFRYSPIGYNTANETRFLSYLIVWFKDILSFFSSETSVTYAAIIFPVAMFILTAIAFFFFARKVFYKESGNFRNIAALIATALFVLIPSLLPRTIAGIPEKESAGFFFLFLALYFFLEAFTSEKIKRGIIYGLLAGFSTALMGLVWGGVIFIFFTIGAATLIAFILGKVGKKELIFYLSWLIGAFAIMIPSSVRFTIKNLISSTSTSFAIGIFILMLVSMFLSKNKKIKEIGEKLKIPAEIVSLIASLIIILILVIVSIGPSLITHQIGDIKSSLISPQTTRWGMTVAENKQPYFDEWRGSFGPILFNIPLFFWMFFVGSIILFNKLISHLTKKEKLILTSSYILFLVCIIFSRYSPNSTLNGINNLSILVYFAGWIIFAASFFYVYHLNHKEGRRDKLKDFNFAYILYFILFVIGIIGARGAIRLIMLLGAVAPVAIAFFVVKISDNFLKEKDDSKKFFLGILAIVLILASAYTAWTYYQEDVGTASFFAPGPYQWQWQKSMQWVRDNTPQEAVFGHWWDYGYWVQSLGERATILDGSNSIVYWNHLMGRYVLTGSNQTTAAEFLYAHKGTHLLIDSTDIGKYTAYSVIGADENYDRFSWIPTMIIDEKQTKETQNETLYIYTGGTSLDGDILVNDSDGKEILLPKGAAGIGAILVGKGINGEVLQPEALFVYNGKQYSSGLRYAYFNKELYDFKTGLDAGVFIFPRLDQLSDGRVNLVGNGALMYLSPRTIHSQVAELYLFNQDSKYFKLVNSQDSYVVESLKSQGMTGVEDFLWYQGLQGPIRIWEITYPTDIKMREEFLERDYPDERLFLAKPGAY